MAKAEYIFLAFITYIVLLLIVFIAFPIISILLGLLFGLVGIIVTFGTGPGDFMIKIATLPWKWWYVTLPLCLVITIAYVYLTKLVSE